MTAAAGKQIARTVLERHQSSLLDDLYRLHAATMKAYVRRTFGPGPPDPDDVVQATFEKYAVAAMKATILNPAAFLMQSARNHVLDERRRMSVRASHAQAANATATIADDLDAERVLDSKRTLAAVSAAISSLDDRSRDMFLMSRIHGLNSAEIARRHGCSPTLVKSIVARALVACQGVLAGGD